MNMLNKLEKIFVFLFIFIISFGFFVFRANAAIIANIDISPPRAKINEPVQIKVSASDSVTNSIWLISLSINGSDTKESHDCTAGGGADNAVNNCSAVFEKSFPAEGVYRVMGTVTDKNTATKNTSEVLLSVTQSGTLPPPTVDSPTVSNITPSPAPVGSAITIWGTKFCPNFNIQDSRVKVFFDQTLVPGGTMISVDASSRSKCTSNVLYVDVPSSLIPDNDVDIRVENIKGMSAPVSLPLQPPLDPGTPGGAATKPPTDKLELTWPDSPGNTSLNNNSTLPDLIQYLYEWGIALGGLAAFIALLIAGIQYLTSFGDPVSMKEAFGRIQSAFWGILLLLSSWLILNTINPDITSFSTEGLNVEKPAVPPVDLTEINLEIKYCESVEIHHSEDSIANPIKINRGARKTLSIESSALVRSAGYPTDEKNPVCAGTLQFFSNTNCTDTVGTPMSPKNNSFNFLDKERVRCIKLY